MIVKRARGFTRIYQTTDQGRLALVKARLDGSGIPYYVENEMSGVGVLGGGLSLLVCVQSSRAEEARQLVEEALGHAPG